MNADLSQNFFELFGLPAAFPLDAPALDASYRTLQREVHPDRFAGLGGPQQRVAEQWSTHLNEAYRTLKSPLARGRYLLALHGIDTAEETNTAMPVDFLAQQMEWREALEEARRQRDAATALEMLDALDDAHRREEATLLDLLARQLDAPATLPDAALSVRKLRFLEKLAEELEIARDARVE